jgi:23S rRNA (pseudouridine1915-N3)-methyltransferase
MRLSVIAASSRQPRWVGEGFDEYAKRMRGSCTLELVEVALGRRGAGASLTRALAAEGERMLAKLPRNAVAVALDERGEQWSTADLAGRLRTWLTLGRPVAFLVGGPDGLDPACRRRADEQWGVSPLTLPHGLVRIVVAEALYRAWSMLEGHPYHRA